MSHDTCGLWAKPSSCCGSFLAPRTAHPKGPPPHSTAARGARGLARARGVCVAWRTPSSAPARRRDCVATACDSSVIPVRFQCDSNAVRAAATLLTPVLGVGSLH